MTTTNITTFAAAVDAVENGTINALEAIEIVNDINPALADAIESILTLDIGARQQAKMLTAAATDADEAAAAAALVSYTVEYLNHIN